ncbi:hypothetical protein GCM10020229_78480 [Kitasatospora albolonga]|uniref:zf-HC2 domain-containing protein n=1 Tax=Kitasatospora albolonga TaxID=68173 RepID=UPI0031E65F81
MNHSSPTEPWSGTDHPDVDLLADLAEGLTDPAPAAELRAHLAGCPECTDTLAALDEVSELLGSLPAEELPPEVAGRLDAALAAEAAAPVVLPSGRSDARARTRQRSRSPRRPRVPRRVLVGAVLAVLGTGLAGALLQSLPTDGGAVTASSGAAKADTAAIGPDGSGPLFTDEGLAAQVRQLVGTGAPAIAGGKGSPSSRPPRGPGRRRRRPAPLLPRRREPRGLRERYRRRDRHRGHRAALLPRPSRRAAARPDRRPVRTGAGDGAGLPARPRPLRHLPGHPRLPHPAAPHRPGPLTGPGRAPDGPGRRTAPGLPSAGERAPR